MNLKIQVSEPFGRDGAQGLFSNRYVLDAAFSTEVLEEGANSMAIELDPDTTIVLRVKEHLRPEARPFADVREQIQAQLIAQRAIEHAKSQGEALLAELQAGKVSKDASWQTIEAATRDLSSIDPQVLQALFKLPKPDADTPQYAGLSLSSGAYVLVQLNGVNDVAAPLNDEELAQYQQILASRAGQVDFNALMQQLELDAKIQRY